MYVGFRVYRRPYLLLWPPVIVLQVFFLGWICTVQTLRTTFRNRQVRMPMIQVVVWPACERVSLPFICFAFAAATFRRRFVLCI